MAIVPLGLSRSEIVILSWIMSTKTYAFEKKMIATSVSDGRSKQRHHFNTPYEDFHAFTLLFFLFLNKGGS